MNIQRYETLKSILLTLLVLLSIVLTWSIWTYQPEYETIENTEYLREVTIGDKRYQNEIVRPMTVVYHNANQQHFSLTNGAVMNNLYRDMQGWRFQQMYPLEINEDNPFQDKLDRTNTLELIFPTAVPIEIFENILNFSSPADGAYSFDRIIIDYAPDHAEQPSAYFVSYNTGEVFVSTITYWNEAQFKERYITVKDVYEPVFLYNVSERKEFFLPERAVKLQAYTYLSNDLEADQFKDALFSNPGLVKNYKRDIGEEAYTDDMRALEVFAGNSLMLFQNPTFSDKQPKEPGALIGESIEFVNDHAGWVDSYHLFSWSSLENEAEFRMYLNQQPIFDTNAVYKGNRYYELSSIVLRWNNDEINRYMRSLIELQEPLEKETIEMTLPSGREIVKDLESREGFDLSRIEEMVIGYQMEKMTSSPFINFKPAWFIRHNGDWMMVKKTAEQGEEG